MAFTNITNINQNNAISKAFNNDIEKGGKKANIGEIRDWNGKKYKKQANGKWLEVSNNSGEKNLTKKNHLDMMSLHSSADKNNRMNDKIEHHKNNAKLLSDKEHTDEEVGIGKKEVNYNDDLYNIKKSLRKKYTAMSSDSITIKAAKEVAKIHKIKYQDILKNQTPDRNLQGEQYWDSDGNLKR